MEMLWWYWVAVGLLLVVAELVVPSFVIVWFGIAAVVVGLAAWLIPSVPLAGQVFAWAVFSLLLTLLWFKVFNPKIRTKSLSGMALEDIVGKSGMVVTPPMLGKRGKLRFTVPVQGSEEWEFLTEDKLEEGDNVVIKGVSGSTLIVGKLNCKGDRK